MKSTTQKLPEIKGPSDPKKAYEPPTLRFFGPVAELTSSFAGSCMSDGSSSCGQLNGMALMA